MVWPFSRNDPAQQQQTQSTDDSIMSLPFLQPLLHHLGDELVRSINALAANDADRRRIFEAYFNELLNQRSVDQNAVKFQLKKMVKQMIRMNEEDSDDDDHQSLTLSKSGNKRGHRDRQLTLYTPQPSPLASSQQQLVLLGADQLSLAPFGDAGNTLSLVSPSADPAKQTQLQQLLAHGAFYQKQMMEHAASSGSGEHGVAAWRDARVAQEETSQAYLRGVQDNINNAINADVRLDIAKCDLAGKMVDAGLSLRINLIGATKEVRLEEIKSCERKQTEQHEHERKDKQMQLAFDIKSRELSIKEKKEMKTLKILEENPENKAVYDMHKTTVDYQAELDVIATRDKDAIRRFQNAKTLKMMMDNQTSQETINKFLKLNMTDDNAGENYRVDSPVSQTEQPS